MQDGFMVVTQIAGREAPQIEFASEELDVRVHARGCVHDGGPDRLALCWPTDNLGLVTAEALTTAVTIRGDFHVRIWGWKGSVSEGRDHQGELWTGRADMPSTMGVPFAPGNWEQFSWYDFDAIAGSMTVDIEQGSIGQIYASAGSLSGTNGVPMAVEIGDDMTLSTTQLEVAFLDGAMFATTAHSADPTVLAVIQGSRLAWIIAVIAVLAVSALVIAIRALRPRDPVLRALHAKDPMQAVKLAASARPAKSSAEAATRAVAYIQAGQLDNAEREINSYALPAADKQFMLACIRARQGRDEEARLLLAASIEGQPAYAGEVAHNADLARVAGLSSGQLPEGYT